MTLFFTRWLGTPKIIYACMILGGGAGALAGSVYGLLERPDVWFFLSILYGFVGWLVGTGFGSWLYNWKWAFWGSTSVALIFAGAISIAIWLGPRPVQNFAWADWFGIAVCMLFFSMMGASLGGVLKLAIDEHRQERHWGEDSWLFGPRRSNKQSFILLCLTTPLWIVLLVLWLPVPPFVVLALVVLGAIQAGFQAASYYLAWQKDKFLELESDTLSK